MILIPLIERVSIHTPTQGVTARNDDSVAIARFNPHTHAGCDMAQARASMINAVSIHTPTQGVTAYSSRIDFIIKFQSTHPRRV